MNNAPSGDRLIELLNRENIFNNEKLIKKIEIIPLGRLNIKSDELDSPHLGLQYYTLINPTITSLDLGTFSYEDESVMKKTLTVHYDNWIIRDNRTGVRKLNATLDKYNANLSPKNNEEPE